MTFQDIHIVNGIVYGTYREACKAQGLLDDDDEIDAVMVEAISVSFGSQLRQVFANLLIFVSPPTPLKFWQWHQRSLCHGLMLHNGVQEHDNKSSEHDNAGTCAMADHMIIIMRFSWTSKTAWHAMVWILRIIMVC